jgi:hypothetical protein
MDACPTQLSGRRLQNHGGSVHEKGLIPAPLPSWLTPLMEKLHRDTQQLELLGDSQPNHCLINEYRPGEGIMSHEDGPAYFPGVCIVSLGAPAVIRFRRKDVQQEGQPGQPHCSVLLMPRSLLVFRSEAYTAYTHGIEEVRERGRERDDRRACTQHTLTHGTLMHFLSPSHAFPVPGRSQVHEERLDSSVCNIQHCPPELAQLQPDGTLPRGGIRISLTVRRVPRVIKGLQLGRR